MKIKPATDEQVDSIYREWRAVKDIARLVERIMQDKEVRAVLLQIVTQHNNYYGGIWDRARKLLGVTREKS